PIDYEYLNEIDMQVDRMANLINNLLVLAKLENYNEQIEFHEFNLSKVILRSILQLEVIAYENNKKLKLDIEEDIMYKGIEKDMTTMMDALIDNAIKYSSYHSDIVVDFKLIGEDRILKISNESSEMTKEECNNIFDGFYRLDQSRTSHSSGFGIGLSVVKNIAIKHGGTAKAYYKGGLFTIKIVL
ncbi:MAG: sensor histidine kinase, partial [Lachnotalea sp.]